MDLNNNAYSKNLGFIKEPFQSTNVYKEELFSKYFIVINYYNDICGDSMCLLLMFVFGCKGVRKAAHKNMMESENSANESILTISYTKYDLSNIDSIDDIIQNYYFKYQYGLLFVSVLAYINATDDFTLSYMFDFSRRQYLNGLRKNTLNTLLFLLFNPSFIIQKLLFSRNFERVRTSRSGYDFVFFLSTPLKHVIFWLALIISIRKLKGVEVDLYTITKEKEVEVNNNEIFTHILGCLKGGGYESIYVLINKVGDNVLIEGNSPKALSMIIKSSLTAIGLEKLIERCQIYSELNVRRLLGKWLFYNILMHIEIRREELMNGEVNYCVGYAFNDIRMAKYICPNLNINLFFQKKMALF